MTRHVVSTNGVPNPLLTHMMNSRTEESNAHEDSMKDLKLKLADAEATVELSGRRIAELEAEVLEQARINGMGGEREATLMGKVQRLESTLRLARGALEWAEHLADTCDASSQEHKWQIENAIKKCNEVLHG